MLWIPGGGSPNGTKRSFPQAGHQILADTPVVCQYRRRGTGQTGRQVPLWPGAVYKTYSPIHGQFLGCTAYDGGRGCHHGWRLNGNGLPPSSRGPH